MDEIITLTKKIVEIPSVSGNEAELLAFLGDFLRAQGGEVWQNQDFAAGLFRGKSAKRAVILTGHIDTVAAGDLAGWAHSPWDFQESEEQISGLGVCDMKAAVATEFIAGVDFWRKNQPDFDLWLVAVANEETDGTGSAAFCEWLKEEFEYVEISGIIGEPTDLAQIEVGHRGNHFIEINFEGISGHASRQENFRKSALSKANDFLNIFEKILEFSKERFSNQILGEPSIVPTSIIAGEQTSPNKTAASAKIILDVRTTPEMDENFANFWNEMAEKFNFEWQYAVPAVPASLVASDSKTVRALLAASNLVEKAITVSPGATDQGEFVKRLGADVVVFGPGDFSQAHRQNEYISKAKIREFEKIIQSFLSQI
ncbi:MAG: M20/M25/M40 family metallo-hydrolase [bacterium]|nr:M20/M25/M40 family metallo-hydrolase [bacterium]